MADRISQSGDITDAELMRRAKVEGLRALYRSFLENTSAESAVRIEELRTSMLRPLDGIYRGGSRVAAEPLVDQVLGELQADGLIKVSNGGAAITHKGMRTFASTVGGFTIEDFEITPGIMALQTAKLVEERQDLETQIEGFRARLAGAEREFYARIMPLLALFLAAFALIITATQAAIQIPPGDPWLMLAQSAAIVAPATVAVLLLVALAWGLTKL